MSRGTSAAKPALHLELYIAGESPNSVAAVRNLRSLLERYPSLSVDLKILDVLEDPRAGAAASVLITPMMIRRAPAPERRIFGTLRDTAALLSVLGLQDAWRE